MQRRSLLTAAALAPLAPLAARAQARPVRIVVPFAAGGPIDVTARILAERGDRKSVV